MNHKKSLWAISVSNTFPYVSLFEHVVSFHASPSHFYTLTKQLPNLQELGLENAWISETIFWCLFIPFIFWSFSPFVTARKRFYTAVIYARILMVLTACQILRIISFTVTQLPAPNYHCRKGEPTAVREMPASWWGHIYVDVGRQATHGCGDLIFSSHTTFVLVGCLTFTEYGETLILKIISWLGVLAMGLCIVASRKHYSVDVIVAWYTVPLVFYAMLRRWTTKRPVQDYWPHRPLVGEEATELAAVEPSTLDSVIINGKAESKPLLPVVVVGPGGHGHSRQSSRSTGDLRGLMGGKPPLPPKEPASPPPPDTGGVGGGGGGGTNGVGALLGLDGSIGARGNGGVVPRAQRRQSSSGGSLGGQPPLEVELRDLESGGGGGGGGRDGNETSPGGGGGGGSRGGGGSPLSQGSDGGGGNEIRGGTSRDTDICVIM